MKPKRRGRTCHSGSGAGSWQGVFFLALFAVFLIASPIFAAEIRSVSVSAAGNAANGGSSERGVSGDGRYATFCSVADNLVPGDTNGTSDVFVKDLFTGSIGRVSVDSHGREGNGGCGRTAISRDGRFVGFASMADNLVPGDTNGEDDIFVHDRVTRQTKRVNVGAGGVQANGPSYEFDLSGDGRYFVFDSDATNLVPGNDNNNSSDVFLRDTQLGTTTRLSTGPAGVDANGGSNQPAISSDGRFVVFASGADNLVDGDTNGNDDIFLLDRESGILERVNVDENGVEANGPNCHGSPSDDGRYVVFRSGADNLAPGDLNGICDIYLRDRVAGTTLLVSRGYGGFAGDGYSSNGHISGDGRFVLFDSTAPDLVPGDGPGEDVFRYELSTETISMVSLSPAGLPGNAASKNPKPSDDGQTVVFESGATDLVVSDTNGVGDILVSSAVSRWPPCDQNGDGKFTMVDVNTFRQACGRKTGDFSCDLDDDGKFRRADWILFWYGCKRYPDRATSGGGISVPVKAVERGGGRLPTSR